MKPYSDAELAALLANGESELAERKEAWRGDAPDKVRQAVCAFANDLAGHDRAGVVFVGVDDDGRPTGLPVDDQLLTTLADLKSDGNILPPPSLIVEKRLLLGVEVAVVTVFPADSPPVKYKGRIWVRTGSRRGLASGQDERILNERRRHRDVPYDVRPVPSATLRDLSRVRFEEEYLLAAFAPDVLAANDRTYEQRLAATKMVATADNPTPTILGLLVLGTRPRDFVPGGYVQFLRIAGLDLADAIVDEDAAGGAVSEILRRVDDKLASHNRVAVDLVSSSREIRRVSYPLPALQQLVRNAILHRTYEATNAPVRVTWFDDRIEILSPGGPFGTVNETNFGRAGVSDYRNPNLAEALRVLGFVQRFGVGIATARRELDHNGNPPPEFDVTPSFVRVTVRAQR